MPLSRRTGFERIEAGDEKVTTLKINGNRGRFDDGGLEQDGVVERGWKRSALQVSDLATIASGVGRRDEDRLENNIEQNRYLEIRMDNKRVG